jgi:hypothetical protein
MRIPRRVYARTVRITAFEYNAFFAKVFTTLAGEFNILTASRTSICPSGCKSRFALYRPNVKCIAERAAVITLPSVQLFLRLENGIDQFVFAHSGQA